MPGPSDQNRLELEITAVNNTAKETESAKRDIKSVGDEVKKTNLTIEQEAGRLAASLRRSVDAYVNRASTAGASPLEKIYAREKQLLSQIGDDSSAAAKAVRDGTQQLVSAYNDRAQRVEAAQRKAETRRQGVEAGGATLAGEAEFQAAFKRLKDRESLVQDLRDRAEFAGKKASERFAIEGAKVVSSLSGTPKLAEEAAQHYKTLEEAAKKAEAAAGGHSAGSQALRRGGLLIKDALEGSTRGAFIEGADILIGTSGSGGILPPVISGIAEIAGVSSAAVIAVGSLAAGFLALGVAGALSVKSLAETGQQIKDFSIRTGIAPEDVQKFQFAARAEGQDPNIFERGARSLAQATTEDSTSGARVRKELKDLGVSLYDDVGQLKPTQDLFLGISDALNKLPPGLQRSAASLEVFKRLGIEFLPVLLSLRENFSKSDEIGNTLTKHDTEVFDEWHKQLNIMGEEWKRFKIQVEIPLAISFIKTVTFAKDAGSIPLGVVAASEELVRQNISGLFLGADPYDVPSRAPSYNEKGQYIGAPTAGRAKDLVKRSNLDADIAAFKKEQLKDPRVALQQAEKDLAALPAPEIGVSTPEQFAAYKAAFEKRESLRRRADPDTNKGLQDIIAARQASLNLDKQIANETFSGQQAVMNAEMNPRQELISQQDLDTRLGLAKVAASATIKSQIEDRRKRVDTKTGRIVDESNEPGFKEFVRVEETEVLPKQIQAEYQKILNQFMVDNAKFYRARTDESMKHYEEEWQRRQAGELELQDRIAKLGNDISDRRVALDIEANDRAKNIAIESLGSVDAQTLKSKMDLEDRKFAIEKAYADRGLALQLLRLNTERARAVAEIEKDARAHGIDPNTDENSQKLISLTNDKYQQDADALRQTTADKELSDAMKTAKAKEDLQIQSNRKIYDSLKQDAAGLFDQLVSHTKSWADFAKDLFKSAILTPVKDIFSSQVAGAFTGLITGNKVSFDPVGSGQGRLGRLGALFGRAGGGQPRFDIPHETALVQSKIDAAVDGNVVRVVVTNPQQVAQAHASAASPGIGASLANSFGSLIGSGSGVFQRLAPRETVNSSWSPETVNSSWSPISNAYSDIAGYGTSPNGFPTMGEISALGTPEGIFSAATSDNPWVLPTAPSYGGGGLAGTQLSDWANPNLGPASGIATSGGSGGILSQIGGMFGLGGGNVQGTPPFLPGGAAGKSGGGGLFGGLGSLFNSGAIKMNLGGTSMTTSGGIAQSLGGGIFGHAVGGLAGFASSGAGTTLGLGIALDGIKRGGVTGTLEAAGGGALVGFRYGGPIGAVIGAVVGGGIAAGKSIFGTTDRQHAKDLAKQVYGMDINNATADAIVQIAKQSYGGAIDMAVRSQQVRDLLKLYAQTVGNKSAQDQFVQTAVHSASFVEAGGKLQQQAVYDNGNAYAYSSQLGTFGGVTTSPLSTFAPNQGVFNGNVQILLNGQAANDALAGQVTKTATPAFVQSQSLAASKSSNGRTAQQNLTLSPSALTR